MWHTLGAPQTASIDPGFDRMTVRELSHAEELALRDDPTALVEALTIEQRKAMLYNWTVWQRPKQATPDGNWFVWMILAGRGFGKTRTGSEFVREQVEAGRAHHVALVGPTAADVRDTMVEGDSGLLAVFPPDRRPRYEPSKRRVTFHTGAIATTYSADEPDRLRGPNHDLAWCDELAAWRYPAAWDMLILGLRIGDKPRALVTTTPRPVKVIRHLVDRNDVHVVTGSTYENRANLAPTFLDEVLRQYEGTRLGRQELHAEILADVDGALWDRTFIEDSRVTRCPDLTRIVVGVDPATTSKEWSAETGIVVAGVDETGHAYILSDRSTRGTPHEWALEAITAYYTTEADRIVAESNQGGEMVSHTLRTVDPNVPIRLVHAARGKRTRAEPIAALYEQGRVHHVGAFPLLEDQLCSWVPDESPSPDRLDALVWALTELMIDGMRRPAAVVPFSMEQENPWTPT